MSVIFKFKDEYISFDSFYGYDKTFIKHFKIEVEDIATGKKKKMQIFPEQLTSAEVSNTKGLETFISDFIYKIDEKLRKEVGFFEFLGWEKEVEWYWSSSYSEELDNPLIIDLESCTENEISIETKNFLKQPLSRLEFEYLKKESGRVGKKKIQVQLPLSEILFKERMLAIFKVDAIREELQRISLEEGNTGRKAFLDAMKMLDNNHEINLLHDVAKNRFAKLISRKFDHTISTKEEAYEKIKNYKLFLGDNQFDCDLISIDELHY